MSAAAPPPTALNSDTSCGIAVIFTERAPMAPAVAPTAVPAMSATHPHAVTLKESSKATSATVARIAAAMPEALTRLPRRAVAGERIMCRPITNVTAAAK